MKIDFSTPINDFKGEQLKVGTALVTLGSLAVDALTATLSEPNERLEQLSGSDKVRNAMLAQKVYSANGEADLSVEEIALIKERIGRAFTPVAVMRAWELLDPKAE